MISITVTTNIGQLIRMVDSLRKKFTRVGAATRIMAEILVDSHQQYFELGGHQIAGGPAWTPTDSWWVQYMSGNTRAPLVWTRNAWQSLRARHFGNKVWIDLPEYMKKFQFGPFKNKTTFPVVYSSGTWEMIPDSAGRLAGAMKTKTIHVHQRHVVDVYDRDVNAMMERLWGEAIG